MAIEPSANLGYFPGQVGASVGLVGKLRTLCLCLSLLVAIDSALLSSIFPYPFPEAVALALLAAALFSVVAGLALVLALGLMSLSADFYYLYSFTLIAITSYLLVVRSRLLQGLLTQPVLVCLRLLFWGNILLCAAQLHPAVRQLTLSQFPYITFGDGLRVAGLKQEPSHLAIMLALSLFLYVQKGRGFLAGIHYVLLAPVFLILVTKSDLLALMYLAAIGSAVMLRFHWSVSAFFYLCFLLPMVIFAKDIALYLYTNMGSWRSIPDVSFFYSWADFLWPDTRRVVDDIAQASSSMLGVNSFVARTYSVLSNGIFAVGLFLMLLLVLRAYFPVRLNLKFQNLYRDTITGLPIYLVAFIFIPKYEVHAIVVSIAAWMFYALADSAEKPDRG